MTGHVSEPFNPGGAIGMGSVILFDGKKVFEHSAFAPMFQKNSNNVAEYRAFETLLDWFIEKGITGQRIEIYGDSNLVIQQMFGSWKIKSGFYTPYADRCKKKLLQFVPGMVRGQWIRRDNNFLADELSKRELIKHNIEFKIQPLNITNEIRENRQ